MIGDAVVFERFISISISGSVVLKCVDVVFASVTLVFVELDAARITELTLSYVALKASSAKVGAVVLLLLMDTTGRRVGALVGRDVVGARLLGRAKMLPSSSLAGLLSETVVIFVRSGEGARLGYLVKMRWGGKELLVPVPPD